jgi:hypothetical protein
MSSILLCGKKIYRNTAFFFPHPLITQNSPTNLRFGIFARPDNHLDGMIIEILNLYNVPNFNGKRKRD